jgi:hypothetical protein
MGEKWPISYPNKGDFHIIVGFFYMPQSCDMGQTTLLPLRRKACWGFFSPASVKRLLPHKASITRSQVRRQLNNFTPVYFSFHSSRQELFSCVTVPHSVNLSRSVTRERRWASPHNRIPLRSYHCTVCGSVGLALLQIDSDRTKCNQLPSRCEARTYSTN